MKRQLIVLMGVLCSNFAIGQNETDALRYSFLNYGGTARFMSTGGSMSALGADMSAITINPAGMGQYKRGDFSFTSNFTNTGSNALYNGTSASDDRFNFNITNIGGVFAAPVSNGSQWRAVQFGYAYNRTNDFQSNDIIKGTHNNSQLDVFADFGKGIDPSELNSGIEAYDVALAYDAFLIDYDSANGVYTPYYSTDEIEQTKTIRRRGAQYSSDFTVSGNFADKFLVGGSFGFPTIRYNERSTLNERFVGDTLPMGIEDYDYTFENNTRGTGFNAKLGVIIIPHESLRFGLAVHTPTWYSLTDRYNASISARSNGTEYDLSAPEEGLYDYDLRTPGRLIGSVGVLIGKRGFVSAEYEYVDYASAQLDNGGGSYGFTNENQAVRDNYESVGNLKIGMEFRMTNYWTIRGGYAQFGSPIKNDITESKNLRVNYSGGIGYKDRNFSLDFAYVLSKRATDYYLYDPNIVNAASLERTLGQFAITAGFRF